MSRSTTNALSNTENQYDETVTKANNVSSDNNGISSTSQMKNISNNNNKNGMSPTSWNRPKTSVSGVDTKKVGHREVKDGVVHYKKVPTDELKKSIQFGVVHSVSFSNKYPDRDILIQDFTEVVTIQFPK